MSETLTLVFPGVGTGTRIRFTLDEVDGATVDNSQVYIEGTFSLKNRTGTDVRENLTDTGDAAAGQYQSMFFDRIFGGMKEEYLKDESDGGIPRAAVRALEEGGDSEEMRDIRDLGGLMEWLDRYLARQTESGKAMHPVADTVYYIKEVPADK